MKNMTLGDYLLELKKVFTAVFGNLKYMLLVFDPKNPEAIDWITNAKKEDVNKAFSVFESRPDNFTITSYPHKN